MSGRDEGGDGNVFWIPIEVHTLQRKNSILTFFLCFERKIIFRFFLLLFLFSLFSAKLLSFFWSYSILLISSCRDWLVEILQSWVHEEFAPETVPQILKGLFYLFQWTIIPPTLTRSGNGCLGQKTAGMLIRVTTPSPRDRHQDIFRYPLHQAQVSGNVESWCWGCFF